ncbi:MAG: TraX family protein [Eubacteriales bacterium]|nr:TraX family protein [Eubacteriales bacterium]
MTDTTPTSFFPEKFRILSGSALKMIAIIIMLIDHSALVLLSGYAPANIPLFTIGTKGYTLYRICRDVGRAAFPIFCFLLVEGFIHTRNRRKYGLNLFLFACISEIPWNFMFTNSWTFEKQNVFFTLFLGYLAFCAIEYFWESQPVQFLCLAGLFLVSCYLDADYGWRGYIFLLIMYWFRNYKASQAIIGSCWLYYEWKACFAFISINMYNGKRGFIKGKAAKYFFYAFYPLHIAVLVILRQLLFYS